MWLDNNGSSLKAAPPCYLSQVLFSNFSGVRHGFQQKSTWEKNNSSEDMVAPKAWRIHPPNKNLRLLWARLERVVCRVTFQKQTSQHQGHRLPAET